VKTTIADYGGDPGFIALTTGSAGATPRVVILGVNDAMIPAEPGDEFIRRLRAVSTDAVVCARLPQTQHAFDTFGSALSYNAAIAGAASRTGVRRLSRDPFGRYAGTGRPTKL
jgi:acetyl esterase/lipase